MREDPPKKKGWKPGQELPGVATRFKPGVSGNPSGKPAMPEDLNKARNLKSEKFLRLIIELGEESKDVLKELLDNPKGDEGLIAQLYVMGMDGNLAAIKEVLDRVMGRSKETVDLNAVVESKSLHMMLVEVMEKHRKEE